MRRILLSISAVVYCSFAGLAQEICGFEKSHQRLMQADAGYRAAVERTKQDWARFAESGSQMRLITSGNDTTFEIPVVIHVIHTGGPVGSAFNPSDAQLIDLIDFTNKCYQASWPAYPSPANGGTKVPFEFVLAKRDPDCAPTTGIVRVDGSSLPNYASEGIELGGGAGAPETAVKALSKWPNDKYYNIWVVPYIGGPGGGTAGYAYYPGAGPGVDGTVILASVAQAGSSTLVHEIGHGMGLPHTFEGDNGGASCPVNNNCNVDGDGICDTEPHMRGASCTDVTNPCTNQPYLFTRNSFMSYSHGCRDRFSAGQRAKMKYNLAANRTSLMLSNGALPPPDTAISSCIPVSLNPGSSQDVGPQEVQFNYIYNASGGFNTDGVHVDYFCEGRTEVYTGNSYLLTVKTGPLSEDVKAYIDYDNDGVFEFPQEEVMSSNGMSANQVHTATVTIPTTGVVLCEPLRMRVISDITSSPILLPCGPLERGQAEDYVVMVKPPATATISALPTGLFPNCIDSLVTFTVNTTNVPPGSSFIWMVNGTGVATGSSFSTTTLQAGDQVTVRTFVPNSLCSTPDTILSPAIAITHLAGPPAPVLSFINGDLVSNVSPVVWFGPSGLIPGVTGAVYHPTQFGNYYAVAQGNPCPSEKSNVLNVTLLDVTGPDLSDIRLYPNPVSEDLTVELTTGRLATVTVYNTFGQVVSTRDGKAAASLDIPVQQLANGVYFIAITTTEGKKGVARIQVLH